MTKCHGRRARTRAFRISPRRPTRHPWTCRCIPAPSAGIASRVISAEAARPRRSRRGLRRRRLVVDELPYDVLERVKTWIALEAQLAWPFDVDADALLDAPRPRGEHDHPVRQ